MANSSQPSAFSITSLPDCFGLAWRLPRNDNSVIPNNPGFPRAQE